MSEIELALKKGQSNKFTNHYKIPINTIKYISPIHNFRLWDAKYDTVGLLPATYKHL